MKYNEIYKVYTDTVNEYLAKGYTFHLSSMGGHQGEIGKVDLYKGEELIRVWLTKEYRSFYNTEEGEWSGDTVVLYVGKWMYPLQQVGGDRTVWMSDFTILQKKEYYKIGRRDGWYLDNLDEALETVKVNDARRSLKDYNFTKVSSLDTDLAKAIASKYMKRVHGYKRISRDLLFVRKYTRDGSTSYKVTYNNKVYPLK